VINTVIRYFDLQSNSRATKPKGFAGGDSTFPVIPQYGALVLGIAVQPFLTQFQNAKDWGYPSDWLQWLPFALIAGLVVFPGVYKNALDPAKPLFVQLCTIFAAGMGWQSLLRTAVEGGKNVLGGG
jgi:hypothetical protein